MQKDSEHTYVNVPVDSKTEEIMEKASIPTTLNADLNVSEKSDSPITANLKQNENITDSTQNLIDDKSTENTNDLLIPEIKQDILPPADLHTPSQNLTFFDDSTLLGHDRQNDYTEIEGILNEQNLILARDNNTNNNERIEIEINENLIIFEPEMTNQALKLPLKEVAKLVPEFDGNNIILGEYIEKLKQAEGIISVTDEQNLVQVLKIKLKGEVYKALANVDMPNIETFIQILRKLYP